MRVIKGHPAFGSLEAEDVFEMIPWEDLDFDESEQGVFLREWPKVTFAAGQNPLDRALELAEQQPLIPPKLARLKLYCRLVSLAGWLQVLMGNQAIFLPTRATAQRLGSDRRTVGNMLKIAQRQGLLRLTKQRTTQEAPRYRFAVEKFPELREELLCEESGEEGVA